MPRRPLMVGSKNCDCNMSLHVETSELHQELNAALKADESRKRTDEMKKRAIHTAASYDEFRHMVSCAQLTPVTRKEMEMLSDQKRGWQGRAGGVVLSTSKAGTSGPTKPSSRRARSASWTTKEPTSGGNSSTGLAAIPVDHSQFQRDWRYQCATDDDRWAYLCLIRPERLQTLFRVEMEPDVLGQVLSLICKRFASRLSRQLPVIEGQPGTPPIGSADRTGYVSEEDDNGELGKGASVEAALDCMAWLGALNRTGRFGMNIGFLESHEKHAVAGLFENIRVALYGRSDEEVFQLDLLRKAYRL